MSRHDPQTAKNNPEVRAPMDNRAVIAEALRAFGQAIYNDLGDIVFLVVKKQMGALALLLETNTPVELEELLNLLNIRKDDDGYRWE